MKTPKTFSISMFLFTLVMIIYLPAIADTQIFEVWGPAGEGAGVDITTSDIRIAINFIEGETTDEMAEHIVDFVNGIVGFSAWRVGNKVYINSSSKIIIEKVNVSNVRINSAAYNNGQAQIARNNMFHFNGLAAGDGQIHLINGDLNVMLPTFAGQTSLQIVDALTDALHAMVPDDGLYSFGMEFNIASFDQTNMPIGSVDLGIWALGNRNLLLTECTSTDTGITVSQDAVETECIPTLSEWAVIILMLLTLTIGTLFILRKKTLPSLVTT